MSRSGTSKRTFGSSNLSAPAAPLREEMQALIAELRQSAQAYSDACKLLSDAKTARQSDPGSYYEYLRPEQTVAGRAADTLTEILTLRALPDDEGRALIERSTHIFKSYDAGQNNVHDRQLLRDCIAFISAMCAASPSIQGDPE